MVREKRKPKPKLLVYEDHDDFLERDLYEKGVTERWLKYREIYNNVFNTVQRYKTLLEMLGYQVAFGYVRLTPTVYVRNCFFVREDKIVDTQIQFYEEKEDSFYIAFTRLDLHEYVRMVLKEEGDLTLERSLADQEQEMINYANKNDITLLGRGSGRFEG